MRLNDTQWFCGSSLLSSEQLRNIVKTLLSFTQRFLNLPQHGYNAVLVVTQLVPCETAAVSPVYSAALFAATYVGCM